MSSNSPEATLPLLVSVDPPHLRRVVGDGGDFRLRVADWPVGPVEDDPVGGQGDVAVSARAQTGWWAVDQMRPRATVLQYTPRPAVGECRRRASG